jgi:hypothetical protein
LPHPATRGFFDLISVRKRTDIGAQDDKAGKINVKGPVPQVRDPLLGS